MRENLRINYLCNYLFSNIYTKNVFKYKVKHFCTNFFFLHYFFFALTALTFFCTNFFFVLTMSRKASTSTSTSALTPVSSVQKGNEFEKAVLENLKFIPNFFCKQVK